MECSHARLLLLFHSPARSELAKDDAEALRVHLEQCGPCRSLAQQEQQLDDAVGPALRAVPTPVGLHGRILSRLLRERRPRPWSWVAGAAALLLCAGVGTAYFYESTPSVVDPEYFSQWTGAGSTSQEVEEWFRLRGVAMNWPGQFDSYDLDSWEISTMQRNRVARLLFVKTGAHETAMAHVYVIPKNAFRLDEDFARRARDKSGNLDLEEQGDFFILSIFSRGSRTLFVPPRHG